MKNKLLQALEDETFFDDVRKPSSCKEPVFWDRPFVDVVPTPQEMIVENIGHRSMDFRDKPLPRRSTS